MGNAKKVRHFLLVLRAWADPADHPRALQIAGQTFGKVSGPASALSPAR